MITEVDEQELERLLQVAAGAVVVPPDGARDVLDAARAERAPLNAGELPHARRDRRFTQWTVAAAAAAIVLVVGIAVAAVGHGGSSANKSSATAATNGGALAPSSGIASGAPSDRYSYRNGTQDQVAKSSVAHGTSGVPTATTVPASGTKSDSASSPATSSNAPGPTDSAKIVATGDAVLEVPKGAVAKTQAAVVAVARGAGGYVADAKTGTGAGPTAEVTIRVPFSTFDDTVITISRLTANLHGKVLSSSTHSADVGSQYTDLQARRDAAVRERDQLDLVEQRAQTIGDILAVHDRISTVQTEIDQLTGQINVLHDQTSFSSYDVSISEKAPPVPAPAKAPKPSSGIAKAWHDAGSGFAHSVEWIIARSGKALVVLVAFLALLFLVRYLYPLVRRGLL